MLRPIEIDDEFFDSVDHLSSAESDVCQDGLDDGMLGYELWKQEPKSVKERRCAFLHEMGFIELATSNDPLQVLSLETGSERVMECNAAVSTSCASSSDCFAPENLVCRGRESNGGANCLVDDCEGDQSRTQIMVLGEDIRRSLVVEGREWLKSKSGKKKIVNWWKKIMSKRRSVNSKYTCVQKRGNHELSRMNRAEVEVNRKRLKELSALFVAQEVQAHNGIIWTMKFSPDGQYLASGGQDGVVRIWRVNRTDACHETFCTEGSLPGNRKEGKTGFKKEKTVYAPIVMPDKVFEIEEEPFQEFHGHAGDILDLAWSNSNCLVSSSIDRTVRMWRVGAEKCVGVFLHTDHVTCVQFNPVDDGSFISGSIDGKVRIWGVLQRRVVDWVDVGDAVTAVCYQSNGQGFAVGSYRGTCHFYEAAGDSILLNSHIQIQGSKKSSSKRITGIQFIKDGSQKVMVTSEDSKVRIIDQTEVICKYRGLPKASSQMSASFTSNRKHIISIGEDSHVYIWNYDEPSTPSSRHKRSIRACEYFYSKDVSVAIPLSGTQPKQTDPSTMGNHYSQCFSLGTLSCSVGSYRGSVIWPEEMLPSSDLQQAKGQDYQRTEFACQMSCATWGLVIVTASLNGTIRTFHNFGLPIKTYRCTEISGTK